MSQKSLKNQLKNKIKMSESNPPLLLKHLSEKFKEPLEMMEKLELMKIPLPKVMVLGDESVGKTSVVGKIVGMSLPCGLKIPLVLKFKFHSEPSTKFLLVGSDMGETLEVSESDLGNKLTESAKLVLSKEEKERSFSPLSLVVLQPYVDDFTIIDVPGIQHHSDKTKQRNEMDAFEGYISEQTKAEECVFINVMSGSADLDSCLSRRLLRQQFDLLGKHTVPVISKLDLCSKEMITDITVNQTENNPRFGYCYVKNDILNVKDESAAEKESVEEKTVTEVESYLLSKHGGKYLGFEYVVKHVVIGMLSIVFNCDSFLVYQINNDLKETALEKDRRQVKFDSVRKAIPKMMAIAASANIPIYQIIFSQEYGKFENDECMHFPLRMTQILKHFYASLLDVRYTDVRFLDYEYNLVTSQNSLSSENLASSELILTILEKQISTAGSTINKFVNEIFKYIQLILEKVFIDLAQEYHQLHLSLRQIAKDIVQWTRKGLMTKVEEILKLEKKVVNTVDDRYIPKLEELKSVKITASDMKGGVKSIEGFGAVKVDHLKHYPKDKVDLALKLKLTFAVYWAFVVERFDRTFAMNLLSSLKDMVKNGIEETLVLHHLKSYEDDLKLPDEDPVVHINLKKLEARTECLVQMIEEIAKIQAEFAFLI